MSVQRKHGQWGEDLASAFLARQGMEILARNWRYRRAEIDIIGREKDVLVFVEVKTKATSSFGQPEEKVGHRKKRLLIDAAMAYMRESGHEWEIRFDIISILGNPGKEPRLTHFRDAFFPGLGYTG